MEYKYVGPGRELLKNADGHVVGQKEMLRDAETGEQYEHVIYFTPRRDAGGNGPRPRPRILVRDEGHRRHRVRPVARLAFRLEDRRDVFGVGRRGIGREYRLHAQRDEHRCGQGRGCGQNPHVLVPH